DIILKEEQNPVEQQKPNDVPGIWFGKKLEINENTGRMRTFLESDTTSGTRGQAVKTAPTVFPLSPCNQDIATTSQVSIGCLVKGYFPEPAAVQWNSGAITILLGSNHYTHSSLLTIPVSQWQSQSFQCNVHHAATDTRINKIIDRSAIRSPVGPEIQMSHSSCDSRDGVIQLLCRITDFYPKQLDIEWKVGSRSGLLHPYNYPPWQNPGTYTFSTTSIVNVTQADWQRGNVYYCEVTHAASQTKVKGKLKKCEGGSSCPSGNVNVYLVPPTPRALYIDRNSKISCVVNNLQNEQGVEEPNGTYTGVRHLNVIAQDWESGESFTCTVEHPSFVSPVIKNIFKTRGNKKAPKVYVFPPHRDELNPGRSLSLVCMANGFYPEDIDIQWLQDHNPVSEDQYVTTPAMKNKHDDSFFAMSKLSISRDDWNERAFTCMVVHEELPMKFTQRNISKTQVLVVIMENDYSLEKEEELEHLWTILFIFFILFLFSVCYSAIITLFK
ncbi:putative Ig mu chain C region membrane-bound form protein, partial [Naja naja]